MNVALKYKTPDRQVASCEMKDALADTGSQVTLIPAKFVSECEKLAKIQKTKCNVGVYGVNLRKVQQQGKVTLQIKYQGEEREMDCIIADVPQPIMSNELSNELRIFNTKNSADGARRRGEE